MNGELVKAAFAVATHDAVEALLAPAGAPAVLDDPVVLGALSAVADNGNTVVIALHSIAFPPFFSILSWLVLSCFVFSH